MIEINLLDANRKEIVERQVRIDKLSRISLIGLVFVGILLLSSVGVNIWLDRSAEQVSAEIDQLESEIAGYEDVAQKTRQIVRKLDAIESILPQRKLLSYKVELFSEMFEADLKFSSIDFRGDDINSLSISGNSESIVGFLEMVEQMKQLAVDKNLKLVVMDSANRNETAGYSSRFSLTLNQEQ